VALAVSDEARFDALRCVAYCSLVKMQTKGCMHASLDCSMLHAFCLVLARRAYMYTFLTCLSRVSHVLLCYL